MRTLSVRRPRSASKRIYLIINQCDYRRPKCASGGNKASASRTAQASEARLYVYIYTYTGCLKSSATNFANVLYIDK